MRPEQVIAKLRAHEAELNRAGITCQSIYGRVERW